MHLERRKRQKQRGRKKSMAKKTKITPQDCPICRGYAQVLKWGGTHRVRCTNLLCYLTGPITETKEAAILLWNNLKYTCTACANGTNGTNSTNNTNDTEDDAGLGPRRRLDREDIYRKEYRSK
jgi:hypothetical protein